MANICLYKVKVCGKKINCYKLIDMMPLYSWEKDILFEDGTDENFTLIFTGGCKWGVDRYTKDYKDLLPYTDEEVSKIEDGDGWDYCLKNKSTLLDVDIYCNSKDIDDMGYAYYEHYNRGVKIKDECPKELHIKRGRDYDEDYDDGEDEERQERLKELEDKYKYDKDGNEIIEIFKVRFIDGYSYWYLGFDYKVGDLVYVDGAKKNILGIIKEVAKKGEYAAIYFIEEKVHHIDNTFNSDDIEKIWNFYKPKERKEYLKSIGLDENINKKKFVSLMENKWILFAKENDDWNGFLESLN